MLCVEDESAIADEMFELAKQADVVVYIMALTKAPQLYFIRIFSRQ